MNYQNFSTALKAVREDGRITAEFESFLFNFVNLFNPTSVTASETVSEAFSLYVIDATSGNITMTLPAAADFKSQAFLFKRVDGSGNSVAISSSDNIDGSGSKSLASQYSSVIVVSDGSTWHIVAEI